ncbi:MAG: DUF2971 domain-containing protein [Pseudoalteromonas sp.]|uniref:DUF2971 domain-containing protein n=1 Tax=Pseudoalteromonas sp. TaxID=53249 RepID=UPI001D73DB66|nr:DUF2971 domain-containing protein [Pseudoalteromonas sp.]NRA81901.1 DUF2971 domain-containing protein [Pseudoalteromonas sp.]
MDLDKQFFENHPQAFESLSSLFKYMPAISSQTKDTRYIEDILIGKRLYHAAPSEFNDPFECKPHFSRSSKNFNPAAARKFLDYAYRKSKKKKERNKLVSEYMNSPVRIENLVESAINMWKDLPRICSFTCDQVNILFWSHYANSHTGICIEFDAQIEPISNAMKVHYSDKYPEFTFPPSDKNIVGFLTKSNDWAYESEYRSIKLSNSKNERLKVINDRFVTLDDLNIIKSIYFGANIEKETKIKILEIIEKSDFSPKVYQMYLSRDSFNLFYVEVKQ